MARCPAGLLDDLAALIWVVRGWPGLVEKCPGVLYARRRPFLHFHLTKEGQRRADVRGRAGWVSLVLPRPISATRRRAFLGLLRASYRDVSQDGRKAPGPPHPAGERGKRATPVPRTAPTARAGRRRRRPAPPLPRRTGS